ncbi:MAG: ABC transporter permease [Bacteroidetes bacterium]|nr:ABC transporter permease [Bacteroidota bacterium]
MLGNYLKTALRNLLRFKVYSAINIVGLAVGMAACMLISLYVQKDMSFDKFNRNYGRIYRVVDVWTQNGNVAPWSLTPTGYANAFVNDFPGVRAVRISHGMGSGVVKYRDRLFKADGLILADSTFFDVFSFPLIEGNPKTALAEPFSVVLSQSEARKIFGGSDPMGKMITVNNQFDLRVTGVAKDAPGNSSIQFNYLVSFVSLPKLYHANASILNNFNSNDYYTFLLLPKGDQVETIRKSLTSFLTKYKGTDAGAHEKLFLQPLSDVHFDTNLLFDFPNKGNEQYDYILSGIALFILLIACVNFINLSTARSATRAKEIGIRKVLGSNRSRLVWQLMMEFAALTLLSAALGFVVLELLLPVFNSAAQVHLSANLLDNPAMLLILAFIWILVVVMASAYPSFYLSSFQPAATIKGIGKSGSRGSLMRKSLIIFQFAISSFLITVTIVMWSQYNFLKSHRLGFEGSRVIYLPRSNEITRNYSAFKQQLLQFPQIEAVAKTGWLPGDPYDIEGYNWTGKSGERSDSYYTMMVDPDLAAVLNLKFEAGRNFSRKLPSDWSESFVINETAAKSMGWTPLEAIGKTLHSSYNQAGRIVGVVKDFNIKSLKHRVEPVVMSMDSSHPQQFEVAMRIAGTDIPATIRYVKSQWERFSPDFPFDYNFLDESFGRLYNSEQRLSGIFTTSSILSIIIACLGLFGLAAYATQERTKEIGIRKVLGATIPQVTGLLTSDFVKLVVVANVIAWPLAYYAMQKWLQNFAYRIDIAIWIFIVSGLLALLIALLTVSSHAIKAATANPIRALRYE